MHYSAPVTVEFPDPSAGDVTNTPVLPDFSLSCTASGSHISRIDWHRNDVLVSDEHFDKQPLTDKSGDYTYCQKTAKQSDIVCKVKNPSCEDISNNLDGTYYCTAFATSAGWDNNKRSVKFITKIQCKF